MDLLAEMAVSPAPEEEVADLLEHDVAAHEDVAVVVLHPFLYLRLAEQVGQEVRDVVGEEVSVGG